MSREIKKQLKYIGILILLFVPLIGLLGIVISRTIITPNAQFFVITKGETPIISVDTWNLTVDGHVNDSLIFTYSNFTSQSSKEVLATLQCVEGPFGTAVWKGVPIKSILDLAKLKNGAMDVVFHAADGYSSSLTIEEASKDDVLLAYEMNGESLPIQQGFPVRVVAPNHQGYKWVKWVVRVEVVNYDYIGYWESRGWSDDASITALSDWIWHAVLLSISLIFGGLSMMSGLKRSSETDFFRDLPKFMNKKFHIAASIGYFLTSLIVFTYWIASTISNRGALFYTVHGIASLISIILVIPAFITGFKKIQMRNIDVKTLHYKLSLYSFFSFLVTIILGFLLFFLNFLRLY